MVDREIIKAEIERRMKCFKNERNTITKASDNNLSLGARIAMCEEILSFIDSLQEEPVSEELEEACEQLAENARKHKAETSSPFFSQTDYKQGVIDGAKWQAEQIEEALLSEVLPCFMHGGEADEVVAKLDEVLNNK